MYFSISKIIVNLSLVLFISYCATNQKSHYYQSEKEIINQLYGLWQIDYDKTTKAMLKKNSFDPDIDIDIYKNFLTQIENDIPDAKIHFFIQENKNQENSNLWEFQYTLRKDQKLIAKQHKGIFYIKEIHIDDIPYLLLELKEISNQLEKENIELVRIEFIEENQLKLSLQNPEQKNIFNEIYFKKSIQNENTN
ncbi:MAG: hypothetical protein KatS3mg129_0627 [Leptospiraceae bacterium]|nr:MAG: hypothetical protein KatS3mg129_0627 [Leptospiraceae bacterium]